MFITSYPCNVLHAVSKEKKPSPGLTRRLMRAVNLFDDVVEVVLATGRAIDGGG